MPDETGGMDPGGVSFRGLRSDDLGLMHRWANAPHMSRWWYVGEISYQQLEEKYVPRIGGREAVKPFVILHEEKPIGYIQSYPISHDEEYAGLVDVGDSAGVDLFIGEAGYLYRGLGPKIIQRFLAQEVFSDPGTAVCVIGPEPENTAAIRAYEKVGFRFFRSIQVLGTGPEYLMKLAREEFEGYRLA